MPREAVINATDSFVSGNKKGKTSRDVFPNFRDEIKSLSFLLAATLTCLAK